MTVTQSSEITFYAEAIAVFYPHEDLAGRKPARVHDEIVAIALKPGDQGRHINHSPPNAS